MSVLVASLQGRTGNQIMQWLFAYAFAQKYGMTFQCDEWIGERIFELPKYERPDGSRQLPRMNEIRIFEQCLDLSRPRYDDREFRGYAQSQRCMIYSKRDAQSWLRFRPEIETGCRLAVLNDCTVPDAIVYHRRSGDYIGYGYPVVSPASYDQACREFGLNEKHPGLTILSEEDPTPHAPFIPDDISFVVDFFRMVKAPTLLRANSSFSWCAALLGNGLVLSPVVDGLVGGKQHDCKFVAGNWPKFAPHLDFVTDLHVADV